MEYEIRFYFPTNTKEHLFNLLSKSGLTKHERNLEKTIQYDQPDPKCSFYASEIDGRLRVRITAGHTEKFCKISWKQRTGETHKAKVNSEIEKEVRIDIRDNQNLQYIFEKVLKLKPVESYERHRTIFDNDEVEIALDEYPFGLALEIESKPNVKKPEKTITAWVKRLGLQITEAYRLSWDDKYTELCKEQGVKIFKHVDFNKPMPEVR